MRGSDAHRDLALLPELVDRNNLTRTADPRALDDENILGSFVDEDIKMPNDGGTAVNLEPLLVNTAGSWANRPRRGPT